MSAPKPVLTEMEIWNRVIRPDVADLSPEEACLWLRLKFADLDVERVDALSRKASEGTLTDQEGEELDHYLNVGQTLDFLKAKARITLRNRSR